MRIYTMTATFGKLEHKTLTLQPGLNVIQAPNEWGKSTWCAFLVAMFYGLNTREKTTKQSLAEKERYAPWSGSPMSGRIDLCWNGRDITIERKSKGRIPLGDFRAYETATGLAVPELTAANCGPALLGVERSVFARSGFIRLSDMPVTEDEALRRRLNSLVSTGDDSGAGERLSKELRELKNRVRYNRSGLLPQAEQKRAALEEKLREFDELQQQSGKDARRLEELQQWNAELLNHRTALAYQASLAGAEQVAKARQSLEQARKDLDQAQEACGQLPPRQEAERMLKQIGELREQQERLQMEVQMLPAQESPADAPKPFRGLSGEEAEKMAARDAGNHRKWRRGGKFLWIFPLALLVAGVAGAFFRLIPGIACAGMGAVTLAAALAYRGQCQKKSRELEAFYGSNDPMQWVKSAAGYARSLQEQAQREEALRAQQRELEEKRRELNQRIQGITGGRGLENARGDWLSALQAWDKRDASVRTLQQAKHHLEALESVAKPAPEPEFPDRMDYSELDTARLLSDCMVQRQKLENRLGQYQGRMSALGARGELETQMEKANARVAQLEQTYAALTIAQETLAAASAQLQRRFAPKITKRAQGWMAAMTDGRYDRLSFDADLALRAGADREDTLREAIWHSDGTADQLYLSLRLAVAEELAPQAPLVLDDALVRFDDARLSAALKLLKELGTRKQVLLFSCQNRERELLQNT